jgi:hypothetical protein
MYRSGGGREENMIYSVFLVLHVTRCSPFDLTTGNDFLKWFLMAPDIIYSTLQQSYNVLNSTKLSELVAQKESSRPRGIMSVLLLAASCIHCLETKWSFRFSKTSSGGFGGELHRSRMSMNGFNSLKHAEVYSCSCKCNWYVPFSHSLMYSFIQSLTKYLLKCHSL